MSAHNSTRASACTISNAVEAASTMTSEGLESAIRLVPFRREHLGDTLKWVNDTRVADPLMLRGPISEDSHQRWFDGLSERKSERFFAILVSPSGVHAGNLGFKGIDDRHLRAELWVYVGPEHQGRGLGRAAVRRATRFAFEQLRLDKLHLHVRPDNGAAIRIYEDVGFTAEGRLRSEIWYKGKRWDLIRMGLEEARWRKRERLGPKVAMIQPAFLPWLGYFELMAAVDLFVFLDDFPFSPESWKQGNRLFVSPDHVGYVTVPIRNEGNLEATFLATHEAHGTRWRPELLRALEKSYGKASAAPAFGAMLREWLACSHDNVGELATDILTRIRDYLHFDTELARSSTIDVGELRGSSRIQALLEQTGAGAYYAAEDTFEYLRDEEIWPLVDVPTYFQDHRPRPYHQRGAERFIPSLSVVDALYRCSADDVRMIMRGTERWLSWEERALEG
jgi:RimJ/RimL family protein N-acetyltransferase